MNELTRYIPENLSDTETDFVRSRAEAMESVREFRRLTSADAWQRLQNECKKSRDDETTKKDMYLLALPLAFSEAGYLYLSGRYSDKSYTDCLSRCLFALEHGVETYDPTKSTFKHHIEQSLKVIMEDVAVESIEEWI